MGSRLRWATGAAITAAIGTTMATAAGSADDTAPSLDGLGLEFLGEATFPTGHLHDGTEVGGLSGIDLDPTSGGYVALSDDRAENGPARYYDLTIDLGDGSLDDGDVTFTGVTEILDVDGAAFEAGAVDPESVRILPFPGLLYWSSEGDATQGIDPFVRIMTRDGAPVTEFDLAAQFPPVDDDTGIRNNLAFESLTFGFGDDPTKVYVATENALAQDGPAAGLDAGSPARVVKLSNRTGVSQQQYVYVTDPVAVAPEPIDAFSTNGLVELLAIDHQRLLAVERSFSVGHGNVIRLYLTTTAGATDVQHLDTIEGHDVRPMPKELLLDLDELGITLDNIEGVTFGPTIDGRPTLILVSDNNFSDTQVTQFLAFALTGD